ncbi:MAG: stage II sporulation protein M [Acidobacteria bacterium]|nr:stage II sporulation protein M [Acidobacteriota bacterium]
MVRDYYPLNHEPIVMLFSTLILPHGIIEIPTMIVVAGFSLYLSSQMTKRIFRKKRTFDIWRAVSCRKSPGCGDGSGNCLDCLCRVNNPGQHGNRSL